MKFSLRKKELDDPPPGGERDVGAIYRKHRGKLRNFISGRVSSSEDADDILQDVFYKLTEFDSKDDTIVRVTSWLYSVAANRIIDMGRKKKEERMPRIKVSDLEGDFVGDLSDLMVSGGDGPEDLMFREALWAELEDALSELPEEQRAVFELTELEGIPFKEISESTGIPVNTLLSRKRYAVLHLRERLSELYELMKEG